MKKNIKKLFLTLDEIVAILNCKFNGLRILLLYKVERLLIAGFQHQDYLSELKKNVTGKLKVEILIKVKKFNLEESINE
ncbi:hypothetical protein ACA758_04150 [Mycoplasmopsis agassizii]|uniref:hypothetical protein n=1 Tax=Mycoplasmopsis agassizii TaxID=33922 RepID=UPI0035287365